MDERTALIVIDMERGFISEASSLCIAGAAATVPALSRLIKNCRERGIPVFFVNRTYRADGSDVEHTRFPGWLAGGKALSPGCSEAVSDMMPGEFGFCEKDYLVIKPRFSAFFATELDMMLRRLRRDTLLLTGTTTPNCVRTTCYDGISLEYNVAVVSDCCSSATEAIQQANLGDMERIGAQILTSGDFISGAVTLRDSIGEIQSRVAKGI